MTLQAQALQLAAQALWLSNPNPRVGCVIADALTKVVMNAGEAAAPILRQYGASALFVSTQGDLHVTPEWQNEVRLAA